MLQPESSSQRCSLLRDVIQPYLSPFRDPYTMQRRSSTAFEWLQPDSGSIHGRTLLSDVI